MLQAQNMRHMCADCQWKVIDECNSGNIFANSHLYSMHILHFVHVRTMQKLCKKAQNCVNSYAKPSFELLKTWNHIKHRSNKYWQKTMEVPRGKKMMKCTNCGCIA
jgi:hypothetical protein